MMTRFSGKPYLQAGRSYAFLYVGLVLSETQFLLNLPTLSLEGAPITFLIIFIMSTLHIGYLAFQYAFKSNSRVVSGLQLSQWLVFPITALLLRFFLLTSGSPTVKIICFLLFLAQGGLIVIKNLYFGSLSEELGYISSIAKIIRVARITMQIALPLVISSLATAGLIMSACQAISTGIVFFRFTFRRVLMEHCLLLLTLGGLVSGLDSVAAAIFGQSYYYVGEVFSLVVWIIPFHFLSPLVELKYLRSLAQKPEIKSEEDCLADFYFIRECLFPYYRSLPVSPSTLNEVAVNSASQIRNSNESKVLQQHSSKEDTEHIFQLLEEGEQGRIRFYREFFIIAVNRFKNSHNFDCLQFLVDCSLDFRGRYTSYALITYYKFCEENKAKSSPLELCRYDMLYAKILRHYPKDVNEAEQIGFVALAQNLNHLNAAVEKCLEAEVQFVEHLLNDERRGDEYIEEKLLKRHKDKKRVRKDLDQCLKSKFYIHCSEFKFLLLLFAVGIEKRPQALREELKTLFFSEKARRLGSEVPDALAIIKGFSHGEITTSNEAFRKIVGLGNGNQTAPSISEIFPTTHQRSKHSELMAESYLSTSQKIPHQTYECFLGIDRQLGGVRLRGLMAFKISTRIYYEHRQGFGYVCGLSPVKSRQEKIFLLRKEANSLEKKGYEVVSVGTFQKQQLGQKMQILQIQGNLNESESENEISHTSIRSVQQVRGMKNEDFLQEKITVIEKKLNEEVFDSEFRLENWIEVGLVLLTCVFLLVILATLMTNVKYLTHDETIQSVLVGQSTLSIRRILLLQTILNFAHGTDIFADDVCKDYGISSLTFYYQSYLVQALSNYFDNFTNLSYRKSGSFPQLASPIFQSKSFNPSSSADFNISFQQYLYDFKAEMYLWHFQNESYKINYTYYEADLPKRLLGEVTGNDFKIYDLVDSQIHAGLHSFSRLVNTLNVVNSMVIIILIGAAIVFRLNDTVPLFGYLRTVKSIKETLLSSRLKELKFSIDQFNKFRTHGLSSLDIVNSNQIKMQVGQKDMEIKTLNEFTNYNGNTKDYQAQEENVGSAEEEDSLMKNAERTAAKKGSRSLLLGKLLLYNKGYLLCMSVLLFGCLYCTISLNNLFGHQMTVIQNFHQISEEFNLINQHYINLLTYNWIKVVSLEKPINMAASNQLYQDAIEELQNVKVIELIRSYYPEEYANSILYGSICPYFQNSTYCQAYRNGVYQSGLSVMLPLTIKEFIEDDQMSDDYTYYVPRLCDRTYIITMGILLVTSQIPLTSFELTNSEIDAIIPVYITILVCLGALTLVLTLCCLFLSHRKVGKVREQMLSLDSVSNLYTIEQFKPYLNQVYYE